MKTRHSLTAAILCTLLLASCSAGTAPETKTTDTAPTETQAIQTEVTEKGIVPDIPEDLDFGGKEVRILEYEKQFSGDNEADATVINSAIYNRKSAVEDRLNIRFEYIQDFKYGDIPDEIKKTVNAAADDYDLAISIGRYMAPLTIEGYALPIDELPYVDLSKPWWNTEYINAVSLNTNEPFLLFGDILYKTIERTGVVYFNKSMLGELCDMSDTELYQTVLDGNWTVDRMNTLCKGIYQDMNGNGVRDEDDRYGTADQIGYIYEYYAYGAGLHYTGRDGDGYPVLDLYNDRTLALVDRLNALLVNNENTIVTEKNTERITWFGDNRLMFLVDRFLFASKEEMRSMRSDFGFVPLPKYDESVDKYYSIVSDDAPWCIAPVTVTDTSLVSAAAEMLAYYGKTMVTPVYYEQELKVKYTRDEITAQIIDMIVDSRTTDFLYMMSGLPAIGNISSLFRMIQTKGAGSFASDYTKYESAAKAQLEKLVETAKAKE